MRDDDVLESWRREYSQVRSEVIGFFATLLFGVALGFILGRFFDVYSLT